VSPECGTVNVKIFLEGAYSGGSLTTALNDNHLLPGQDPTLSSNRSVQRRGVATIAGQPYSDFPWQDFSVDGSQFGDDSVNPGATPYDAEYVDWILISVRAGNRQVTSEIWSCVGLVKTDGTVEFPEECECLDIDETEDYYIVVEHRNHLPVMTPNTATIVGSNLEWDFTTSNSFRVRRQGQKEVEPGVWAMYAGNADQQSAPIDQNIISSADRVVWFNEQNLIGYFPADFNMDGFVTSADQVLWFANQNVSSDIPR